MYMRSFLCMLFLLVYVSCTTKESIKLSDRQENFEEFSAYDSLQFTPMPGELLEEPAEMLFHGDYLIIAEFNKAHDTFLSLFSLKENKVVKQLMQSGNGPEEMMSCDISMSDNYLCLYDLTRRRIGRLPIDSLLCEEVHPVWTSLDRFYYRVGMLNDSTMLGTNDMTSSSKITYVNLVDGTVVGKGEYAYLDESMNHDALIDACSGYIDVNPETKDIVLSYRYTDVVEFYSPAGELKHALQGPDNIDIVFRPTATGMGKTQETRKAFVNTYVTDKHVYLLYSGCSRTDENWAYGSKIFVYSWDGIPQKCYLLDRPIYTFAVDESRHLMYSYSMRTGELIMGKI